MTNIYLVSDLHYEVWGLDGPVKVAPGADIVVIAGDLRGMPQALETCGMTAESTGLPVIFTPGNHE
ncbi:MAG: metallophosphoesterase, partial [Pseudomonadales bacterium]|nr:metallophosphoesterase [Pseudomonadales bacterium]